MGSSTFCRPISCVYRKCLQTLNSKREILWTLKKRNLCASTSDNADLSSSLDEDETQAILETLNSSSEEELYKIPLLSRPVARNVVIYRQEHGSFRSISDMVKVSGIGPSKCEKISHSILKGELKKNTMKKPIGGANFVIPALTPEQYMNVQNIVSYQVRNNHFVWIHMNQFLEVLDWFSCDLQTSKYEHHVYQSKIHAIVEQIPQCSLYISEEHVNQVNHIRQVNPLLQDARLEAITTTLLNHDLHDTELNKVFKMKTSFVAKYFNLLIAGEKISGKGVVSSILNNETDLARDMFIPSSFVTWYFSKSNKEKDEVASTLLTAIAFLKTINKRKTDKTESGKSAVDHTMSESESDTDVMLNR